MSSRVGLPSRGVGPNRDSVVVFLGEVDPYFGTFLDRAERCRWPVAALSLPHPQCQSTRGFRIEYSLDSFWDFLPILRTPNSITPIYTLVLSEGGDFSYVQPWILAHFPARVRGLAKSPKRESRLYSILKPRVAWGWGKDWPSARSKKVPKYGSTSPAPPAPTSAFWEIMPYTHWTLAPRVSATWISRVHVFRCVPVLCRVRITIGGTQ